MTLKNKGKKKIIFSKNKLNIKLSRCNSAAGHECHTQEKSKPLKRIRAGRKIIAAKEMKGHNTR